VGAGASGIGQAFARRLRAYKRDAVDAVGHEVDEKEQTDGSRVRLSLSFSKYSTFHAVVSVALGAFTKDERPPARRAAALRDWTADTHGCGENDLMQHKDFQDGIFEIADQWTLSTDLVLPSLRHI
jgi:hypothetical protein